MLRKTQILADTECSQVFWFSYKTPTSICVLSEKKACVKCKEAYFTGNGKAIAGALGWEHELINICQCGSLPGESLQAQQR